MKKKLLLAFSEYINFYLSVGISILQFANYTLALVTEELVKRLNYWALENRAAFSQAKLLFSSASFIYVPLVFKFPQ